jgi:hypothetical protein
MQQSQDGDMIAAFTKKDLGRIEAEGYFAALRALERAEAESDVTSRSEISRISGFPKETVTRVLNGSAKNITLRTLFVLARAMGFKIFIEVERVGRLRSKASNFDFSPTTRRGPTDFAMMPSAAPRARQGVTEYAL